MGIALVKEALVPVWAGLTPFARLVLVTMASTALDAPNAAGDEARLYFGGHGHLALLLTGTGEEAPGYASAKRRIRRAISELVVAGAVTLARPATNGRRAVYGITTNQWPLPVDNSGDEDQDDAVDGHVEGDISVLLRGTSVSSLGGHQCPPKGDISVLLIEEQQEEQLRIRK